MNIKGSVINAVTREPVGRAKVVLAVGERELAELFSDKDGNFELVEGGSYINQTLNCRCEKEGFQTTTETTAIEQNAVLVELAIIPEKPVEIEAPPPASKPWLNIAIGLAVIIVVAVGSYFLFLKNNNPEIVNFSGPKRILIGKSAILTWETRNAQSVVIQFGQNSESVEDIGTFEVYPKVSTTYTLIAKGRGKDNAQQSHSIVVKPRMIITRDH
jgi:hypothetical protein